MGMSFRSSSRPMETDLKSPFRLLLSHLVGKHLFESSTKQDHSSLYLYYTQRLIKMSSSSPYLFTYRIIYIPHHRTSGKKLVILLVPRRITDGKHLLLYIVPQKLKKVNHTFLYFNRYTMYLYYITQLSVLCYCNLITNFSCKKVTKSFVPPGIIQSV